MANKTSKAMIGIFVIGALALFLIAVAVVGSGKFFKKQTKLVMFFDSSLKGLSIGSPVTFRGVPVGRVVSIHMAGNLTTMDFKIPVYVNFDSENSSEFMEGIGDEDPLKYLEMLVKNGLRGRLNNQSFLTGQLLIELDLYSPAQTAGSDNKLIEFEGIPVIPTIPSQFDTIWQRISQLPIDQLFKNMVDITKSIDSLLNTKQFSQAPENFDKIMAQAQTTMENFNETLTSFKNLADNINALSKNFDGTSGDTIQKIDKLLTKYIGIADNLDATLNNVKGVVGPNTVSIVEINRTLKDIGDAAKAVKNLAITLERNPEAILTGKSKN